MKILNTTIALFIAFTSLNAQVFEIRVREQIPVTTPRTLIVEMQETSGMEPTTANFLVDLVFGLKWDNSLEMNLGTIDNSAGYGMTTSGGETVDGSDEFQAFALGSFMNFPANWLGWTEIMRIPVTMNDNVGNELAISAVGDNVTTDPTILVDATSFTPNIVGSAILPVKLHTFNVLHFGDRGVKLDWSTASELNGSHFEIHRSTDANNWEHIGEVSAVGESTETQEYGFLDENVGLLRSNTTFYYRLKMFDKDGTFEYSNIRSVTFDVKGISITTYPNPTSDMIKVNMVSDTDLGSADADAYILDNTGRILTKNKISSNGITEIDLNELPSGILMLKVEHNKKTYTHKIIKVD